MAQPTVNSLLGFGSKATLTSTTITGTVSGKMRVTGLDRAGTWNDNELRDGLGTFVGAVASGAKRTLAVSFVYTDKDFPDVPPYEVITVASASHDKANGKWLFKGTQNMGATENGFSKYTLALEQELAEDCATIAFPTQ